MVKKMKFPGLKSDIYYLFDDGRIWSKYKKDFLIPNTDPDGYLRIGLIINGKKRQIYIHKLMEYNYMDITQKKNFKDPTVDHIDSNKKNNYYTNLRYLERSDNTRRGKHYKNTYNHHVLTEEDVHLICKLFIYSWTPEEIDNLHIFNISRCTLQLIYRRIEWKWISEQYHW